MHDALCWKCLIVQVFKLCARIYVVMDPVFWREIKLLEMSYNRL